MTATRDYRAETLSILRSVIIGSAFEVGYSHYPIQTSLPAGPLVEDRERLGLECD
jgi:hypothetical protein